MSIDLTRLTANTQTWAQNTSTASVIVPLSDGGPRALTGMAAAAYLFGQALTTVKYQDTMAGVQLTDGRFEFPPSSGQWVTLSEVADALRYKYGVDPLIEFAPGLGLRGYSVPDINRILELLNREFADSFNIALTVSRVAVEAATMTTFNLEKAAASVSSTDTAADFVIFTTDPNWVTGTPVRVSAASGGLSSIEFPTNTPVDYFIRNLGDGKYSFFETSEGALGTTTESAFNLTSNIGSGVTLSYSAPTIFGIDYGEDSVTFLNDPDWETGTPVRVSSGLDANVDYFVRNIGSGKYIFFASEAESLDTGTTGRIILSGRVDPLNLERVSFSYIPAAVSNLLNTVSTPILAGATETELRQNLTEGGDLYTDRFGAFYLNGVRTQAMDVAVTSRLLVQDNVSAEYKTLMDELAERNNLIAAARTVLSGGASGLPAAVISLGEQYGMADVLSELTAGQFSSAAAVDRPTSTIVTAAPAAGKVVFATAADPAWSSGTRVRAAATGGGLTAGVDYFVRSLGSGEYSLFSSKTEAKASATNQISPGQIAITGPIMGLMIPTFTGVFESQSAGFVPSDTDWGQNFGGLPADESIQFPTSADPGWSSTTRVRVNQSGSGLFTGRDYFVKRFESPPGSVRYSFHTSPALTSRVNLTGNVTAAIFAGGTVTFTTDPAWSNGTRVQASVTGGGLTAGTDYFVREMGPSEYSLFDTAANAKASGDTGRVILTGSFTASITNINPALAANFTSITALLNTLISNKVRDGDLDQAKLQTLTAQLQNNTEAMTALIKAFTDMNAQLARAL